MPPSIGRCLINKWVRVKGELEVATIGPIAIHLQDWSLFVYLIDLLNGFSPHLLVGMVSSYRYVREGVDETVAKSEADGLHDAIANKNLQEHVI